MNWKNENKNRIGAHNIDIISLLYGSLLGESYGEKRWNSTRFVLQQEESNMEYLMWFHSYLAERGYCSPLKPKVSTRIGVGNKVRFFYRIRTFSYSSFNWIYEDFYKNEIKRVPPSIENYFTPLSLAVWIMDDGVALPYGLQVSTHSFPFEDIQFLCFFLNKKYGLTCKTHKKKRKFVIFICKKSMNRVRELVQPYFVKSMVYKLGIK
jgi:ubiquinol-cytochrome c reductase cytochrome b subunit